MVSGREGGSLPFGRNASSESRPSVQDEMTKAGEVNDQGSSSPLAVMFRQMDS